MISARAVNGAGAATAIWVVEEPLMLTDNMTWEQVCEEFHPDFQHDTGLHHYWERVREDCENYWGENARVVGERATGSQNGMAVQFRITPANVWTDVPDSYRPKFDVAQQAWAFGYMWDARLLAFRVYQIIIDDPEGGAPRYNIHFPEDENRDNETATDIEWPNPWKWERAITHPQTGTCGVRIIPVLINFLYTVIPGDLGNVL